MLALLIMEDRIDKYTVEWKTVQGSTYCPTFKYATLTITELWSIGHILFKTPLVLEVYFPTDEEEAPMALAIYDFGMEQRIPLDKVRNFVFDYAGNNAENDPLKTVFSTVKFDLMHAFFHYNGDPNYGYLHWALYGNLKDRVDASDDFIFEDEENPAPNA